MAGLTTLTDYQQRARAGRARFVADHPHLFLVRVGPPEVDDDPWKDELSFATRVPGIEDLDDDDEATTTEIGWIIAPVKKREGGPFPDRIGIGRARNCDVVLRFATISKLHAQLRLGDPLTIVDIDSANGTKLNGRALQPRKPEPIVVGDRLELGAVELRLLDAGELFTLLGA
jgi:hypothetical protein